MRVPLTCAFLLGVAGGARSMLPAAAVSRAVRAGSVPTGGTRLAFLEGRKLNRLLVGLALSEIVADKLPITPSRKQAAAFAARVISGALAGAAVGAASRRASFGMLLGIAGAIVGTEGGAAFRSWLASLFDRDLPAAVIEDLVALALIGYVSRKLDACTLPAAASRQRTMTSGLLGLGRSVIRVLGGREGFGGGSTEIKKDDLVGAGMEPWSRRVQREFRPNIPETSKRTRLEKCNSFRNSACFQEGVFDF